MGKQAPGCCCPSTVSEQVPAPTAHSDPAGAVLSRQRFCCRAQETELSVCLASCGASSVQNQFQAVFCQGSAEMPAPSSTAPQPAHRAHGFETSHIRNPVFVAPLEVRDALPDSAHEASMHRDCLDLAWSEPLNRFGRLLYKHWASTIVPFLAFHTNKQKSFS